MTKCLEQRCKCTFSTEHAREKKSVSKSTSFLNNADRAASKDLSQETLTFGMRKGKSFQEVFLLHPTYCQWMLGFSKPGLPSCRFAEWIRERDPDLEAKMQESMMFGRHRGKSYEEIFTSDPSYCESVLDLSKPGSTLQSGFRNDTRISLPRQVGVVLLQELTSSSRRR